MASKAEISKLFKAAMSLDNEVERAQQAVQVAMDKRSKAVKAVFEANGNDNGPFNFNGKLYTIRKRPKKTENDAGEMVATGEETWFFVSIGDKAVTAIE